MNPERHPVRNSDSRSPLLRRGAARDGGPASVARIAAASSLARVRLKYPFNHLFDQKAVDCDRIESEMGKRLGAVG